MSFTQIIIGASSRKYTYPIFSVSNDWGTRTVETLFISSFCCSSWAIAFSFSFI